MRTPCLVTAAAVVMLTAPRVAGAQARPGAAAQPEARARAIADVVAANHILAYQEIVDGYGHVSIRDPSDPKKFLLSRHRAPELVSEADVLVHDLEGKASAPPDTRLYSERFIHAEIYRTRPDVNAIVHCHAPSLIPFGVAGVPLRPIYHMSAFLGAGVPVFDIRQATGGSTDMLIRTPELGKALAQALGSHPVALMRGHGAVIVGSDIQQVVFRSVYTEMNAKLQAQAIAMKKKTVYLDPEEARKVEENRTNVGRSWELWVRKLKLKEK